MSTLITVTAVQWAEALAEAWDKGHWGCLCVQQWDLREPCANPYRPTSSQSASEDA